MSYSVNQRTRELGVRLALGAARRDLLTLVLRQSLSLAASGIVIGLGLSFAVTPLVTNLLVDVSARDPLTFLGITLLLALAASLASVQPAWRATRVDPTVALRSE
jgi:ABC-type antimicrobial peptide transport system permease subunit